MKKKTRGLGWKLRKYYRWFRTYRNRVRQVEAELGGALEAC